MTLRPARICRSALNVLRHESHLRFAFTAGNLGAMSGDTVAVKFASRRTFRLPGRAAFLVAAAVAVAGCGSDDRSRTGTSAAEAPTLSIGPEVTMAEAAPADAPPITTDVAVAGSATVATSATEPSTSVKDSRDWIPVLPVSPLPVSMADVPVLVPERFAPTGELTRSGSDEPASPSALTLQVYGNSRSDWLHVETVPSVGRPQTGATIGPWMAVDRSGPGSDSILELSTSAVTVTLWSQSLNTDQLTSIAEQIRQNVDGTWDLGQLPDDLELVAAGPVNQMVARRVVAVDPDRGVVLALEVIPDAVALLSTYGTSDAQVVQVNAKRALYYERPLSYGTVGTLIWEYAPRMVVRFGAVDTEMADLVDMAQSIQLGTIEDWRNMSDVSGGDGCPAFWC